MFSKLSADLRLLRISSWAKNLFVFVPLIFAKQLFDKQQFTITLIGFLTFCIAASVVYIFNDIVDSPKDAIHPIKKSRPIASGEISVKSATMLGFVFLAFLILLTVNLDLHFSLIVWAYVVMNILYTTFLKQVVIVDIFCIALGFMLRIVGGAQIISVYISSWLILTTLFLSLFLAVMKRRVEYATSANAAEQRSVLKEYSLSFIDQIAAITGGGVIISYALYTVADRTIQMFQSEYFVFTTLFVIFGIFRYMYIVYKKDKGENVVEAFLADLPMIINMILYVAVTVIIIYFKKYA